MEPKLYNVKNNGKSPRIFQTADNRRLVLAPGQFADNILIKERTAASMLRAMEKGGSVTITPVGDLDFGPETGTQEPETETESNTRADEAKAIISSIENGAPYAQYYARAKEFIGKDDWPSGNPRKKEILEILRAIAEE